MPIEPNAICHCDCLALLERLEDNSIDLVYLDPPWHTSSSVNRDLFDDLIFKVAQQAKRVLKETGNLFLYSRPDLNFDFQRLLKETFSSDNLYVVKLKWTFC